MSSVNLIGHWDRGWAVPFGKDAQDCLPSPCPYQARASPWGQGLEKFKHLSGSYTLCHMEKYIIGALNKAP